MRARIGLQADRQSGLRRWRYTSNLGVWMIPGHMRRMAYFVRATASCRVLAHRAWRATRPPRTLPAARCPSPCLSRRGARHLPSPGAGNDPAQVRPARGPAPALVPRWTGAPSSRSWAALCRTCRARRREAADRIRAAGDPAGRGVGTACPGGGRAPCGTCAPVRPEGLGVGLLRQNFPRT
jgi:hypothetical protein